MDAKTVSLLVTAMTPVIAPLLITGMKKLLGNRFTALYPVICSLFGFVIDLLNYFATGTNVGVAWSLALGAAGVGLREMLDQLKKNL